MITWVLIVFAHVGVLGKTDSNALTSVPGFTVLAECMQAGDATKTLSNGTVKDIKYVCVKQTK